MAMITGCDMTSSGRSIRAAYSMSAKQGLQPLVSRLTVMYDSRSGMRPLARSSACLATAMKNRSIVWMNRFVHPGPPVWTKRLKNLLSPEINFSRPQNHEGERKKTHDFDIRPPSLSVLKSMGSRKAPIQLSRIPHVSVTSNSSNQSSMLNNQFMKSEQTRR